MSQALATTDKPPKKRMQIRGKLQVALDKMIWEGLPFNEAAHAANFNVCAMRKALGRPHVLAYLRAERDVLRASMCPRNIHVLAEVRDQTGNQMARVQAVKALEQLGDEQQASVTKQALPGLVVVVNTVQPVANPLHVDLEASAVDVTHGKALK